MMRPMSRMRWVDQLVQDLRYAFRVLARDRGFSFVAALALALGIAATTSLLTVVNAVLLKGLPVSDSDRLVAITMRDPRNPQLGMSYPDFDDWQRASRSFSGMTVMLQAAFSVSDDTRPPEQFFGPYTTANLFTIIGQRLFAGIGVVLSAIGLFGMTVQTSATDPRVLAGVGVTLFLVAVVTCVAPARRAIRIEPVDVLRTGR